MVMSIIRCIFTIVHFHLICNFVNSKPPGRKMVWNTIENFQICLDVLVNWCTLLATLLLSSSRSHSRSHPRSRSRSWSVSVHGQVMDRSDSNSNFTSKVGPELYTKIGFHRHIAAYPDPRMILLRPQDKLRLTSGWSKMNSGWPHDLIT